MTKEGAEVNTTKEILKEIIEYYSKQFRKEETGQKEKEFLSRQIRTKVMEEDKQMCENNITETEMQNAIKQMQNRKSPGIDGLPCEFHKHFKTLIVPILIVAFNEIYETGKMSPTMKKGIIKMVYKKKGDTNDLKNYRQITVLNTDYKVLAKILSNRTTKCYLV